MKNKKFLKLVVLLVCIAFSSPAMAQFDLKKAISGAVKMAQAVTLTDEQMSEYVILHGWTLIIKFAQMIMHIRFV